MPDLDQLLHDPKQCASVSPEEALALLLELSPVVEALRCRAAGAGSSGPAQSDDLLTIAQAAPLLGLSVAALYKRRNAPRFRKMLVDMGTRTLRFSRRRIEEFKRTA